MPFKTVGGLAVAALLLAGCSADSGPRQSSGAVLGGVAGGLLGSTIGHGNGRAAATIMGAALGAIVGSEIGRSLDQRDREYAYAAAERSFREGREETWENPDTGHRGEIRLRRTFDRGGDLCRDFTHTIWVDGEPQYVEGTACEMPDGSWEIVA
ncbi:MAG: glycine zipper 2TM domain-containing protein [Rhizobiales bacterium]|nr:glycine zipper 2TM domain-containing protein [Hyphomicrobiales bacterium]MBI3674598.1 glycine zipper 2TM domain-containing protein [Hyphomicrobiales bacterium]